jgi:single-stranded DNA-binding protein
MKETQLKGRIGNVSYTPAYNDGSKDISQMIKFSLNVDENGKKEDDAGDWIDVTVWGPYADTQAKALSIGKKVTVLGKLEFYTSRIMDKTTGQFAVNSQGVPLTTRKISVTGREVEWDDDSQARIDEQIHNYVNRITNDPFLIRPPHWNMKGTQDAAVWEEIKKYRNNAIYQPGMATFGFAKVQPLGPGKRPIENRKTKAELTGYTQPAVPPPVYPTTPPVYPTPPQQFTNQPPQQFTNQPQVPNWHQQPQPMQQYAQNNVPQPQQQQFNQPPQSVQF